MLKYATDAQYETFERLKFVFGDRGITFTLIGAAACREYGMPRLTNDLDIVVVPYPDAMAALSRSGEFVVVEDDCPDPTNRTCTQSRAASESIIAAFWRAESSTTLFQSHIQLGLEIFCLSWN